MLSVGAREKAGVSIKYSVMALCEISHSQICDPESVRFLFHVFWGFLFIFLDGCARFENPHNGPDSLTVKLSVGKEAQTNPPAVLIYPQG